jgi:phage shock protein A
LERVQLREGALKHKTEVETIVLEHQAEVDALRTGYESQLSNIRQQVSDLQQRLENTEGKLADAQVRSALTASQQCLKPGSPRYQTVCTAAKWQR